MVRAAASFLRRQYPTRNAKHSQSFIRNPEHSWIGPIRLDDPTGRLARAADTKRAPNAAASIDGNLCKWNEFDAFADGIEPLLGLARKIFAGYDGSRAFRMNSPCGGDYHAYDPQEIYTAGENWYHKIYDRGHNFISEWSVSSFANRSLLKRIIPPAELALKPVGYDVENFQHRFCAAVANRGISVHIHQKAGSVRRGMTTSERPIWKISSNAARWATNTTWRASWNIGGPSSLSRVAKHYGRTTLLGQFVIAGV